jgi:hypothetical protein
LHRVVLRKGETRGTAPCPLDDELRSLKVDGHLLDRSGERKRRLAGEFDVRTGVHADIEPFVGRDLDRDGFGSWPSATLMSFTIADKAQLLLNALADVAIIAIIDEATGYQKRRAHNVLQAILAAYIAPELMPWQKRFPNSYYEQIDKVVGWKYDASSTARTAYVGKLTNKLIWDKLPPGVAQELRRLNPVDPTTGRRKRKHHQLLTDDVEHPHLQNQIMAVTTLMRATPAGGYRFFEVLFNNAFPPTQGDLFTALELDQLGKPDADELFT